MQNRLMLGISVVTHISSLRSSHGLVVGPRLTIASSPLCCPLRMKLKLLDVAQIC